VKELPNISISGLLEGGGFFSQVQRKKRVKRENHIEMQQ